MRTKEFCEKYGFTKDDVELLIFHDLIVPVKRTNALIYYIFNEIDDEHLLYLKERLKQIYLNILASDISKEWKFN